MTKEEFCNQQWGGGMRALYRSKVYEIVSCNFQELLVGLEDFSGDLLWVRCENVELLGIENGN